MPGVLLVSMTTGSGCIKISGANGAERVGVTPKEDKHNYSEPASQSGNSEVCQRESKPGRYTLNTLHWRFVFTELKYCFIIVISSCFMFSVTMNNHQ